MKLIIVAIVFVSFLAAVYVNNNTLNLTKEVGNVSLPKQNTQINTFNQTEISQQPKNIEEPKLSKVCPYKELCIGGFVQYNGKIYCNGSCERKQTNLCNFNRICEGSENSECLDCQCFDGVVCSGICYRNSNKVCNSGFLIENKTHKTSLDFDIALPHFLKLNQVSEGKVIIKNNKNHDIESNLTWNSNKIEILDAPKGIKLKSNEIKEVPIKIKGTKITKNFLGTKTLDKRLDVAMIKADSNFGNLYREFVVFDDSATKCGDGFFNYKGVCVGNIFFVDGDCESGEGCIDRIDNWFSQTRYLDPKGSTKIGFVFVDIPFVDYFKQHLSEIGNNVSKYYKQEAIRYNGKDIIDLNFSFIGSYNFNISNIETDLEFSKGFYTSSTYTNLAKHVDFDKYDVIMILVPKIPSSGGESGGVYYGGKFILLDAGAYTDITVAHELGHAFGCRDLDEKFYLCKNRWKGSLYCEETGKKDIWRTELGNCAYEMGWFTSQEGG